MNPARYLAQLVLASAVLLSAPGCKSKADSRVVGTWIKMSDPTATVTFDDDGAFRGSSGRYSNSGKYEVEGDTVKLKSDLGNSTMKIDGTHLTDGPERWVKK
jgi:hypothetical protein